ncbi:MAG: hypothetical protein DMF78_22815 [Acidobacteria bacterium]|nr:MAG: hypothetical protein DMF78_22815 [Acidobacteriota bacterium]
MRMSRSARKFLTLDSSPGLILNMRMLDGLTIGDLAERCGVSRDTLRFYERERLLSPPRRSASGWTPGTCRRVATRLSERIEVLDGKIAELNAFRGELAAALAQCEEGAESCPVVLSFARDGSNGKEIG